VHLVGFIVRNLTRCTVLCESELLYWLQMYGTYVVAVIIIVVIFLWWGRGVLDYRLQVKFVGYDF
jgi:hypothetical protein